MHQPRVLIIGCGFGGLEAAKALRDAPVEVTLVDRTNHHLFQPLLYQVATAGLSAPAIAAPIRHLFRRQANLTTLLGEVVDIDPIARTVRLADGGTLPWDRLIVAAGAVNSYFGNDAWARHAPGLKTLDDAFGIRRKVLMAFEAAEREADPVQRAAWLNFVVIGGGPTGVEMAGTLAEIAHRTLPGEFRHIDPARAKILLVEGGPRLLSALPGSLSESARRQLERLGVQVQLSTKVTAIDGRGVELRAASGESRRIESRCVVWAAGVRGSPLGALLARRLGIEVDRGGRVPVLPDLTLPGHPEITVIGDLAAAHSHERDRAPRAVPGVSPAAKQMGRHVAQDIVRHLRGEAGRPFRYRDWGNLATIGRRSAVVDLWLPLGRFHMRGTLAWLFWLFAHIYFLIGFRSRLMVMTDWAWAYWTSQRSARVVADIEGPPGPG
ncbi:NAD(P)/FAD-dependent oxidoreductase [Ramlibacter aurantiacus]|uniref:NAD(P)/FAD-dependent oxidoreductase n=1 Tax=Ramlibacter aurantiacus TaxID=2801330 RepID=UPI0033904981